MAEGLVPSPLASDRERVGILHNQPLPAGAPGWEASRDVLVQVEAVAVAVNSLGHQVVLLPFNGDPQALERGLHQGGVTRVVNLCESVGEDPTLIGHPAALLELLRIPFTGSSAFALMLSTDKVTSKLLLQGAGVRTPRFFLYDEPSTLAHDHDLRYPLIAKPRYEDASIGIDQESVFATGEELARGARQLHDRYGPLLIEEYIPGREINVAVLGDPELKVLAVAEIDFSAFPQGMYPIVGYRAKWDESAFEYHHTPRLFPEDLEANVLTDLRRESLRACRVLQVRDYARVDLRLDSERRSHVLEVNANPCLSPDAGFCAAARHQGIDFRELVARLLRFAGGR